MSDRPDDLTARARKRAEEMKAISGEFSLMWYAAEDLRSLADRVDEQERRIKELEGEVERLKFDLSHANAALSLISIYAGQRHVEAVRALSSPVDAEALSQKGGE